MGRVEAKFCEQRHDEADQSAAAAAVGGADAWMQESPTRRQHPSTSSLTEGKPPLKKLQLGDVDASNLTQSAALPTSLPSASTEPVEDGSGMDAMERSAEEWEQQNRNFRMKTFADDLRDTPQGQEVKHPYTGLTYTSGTVEAREAAEHVLRSLPQGPWPKPPPRPGKTQPSVSQRSMDFRASLAAHHVGDSSSSGTRDDSHGDPAGTRSQQGVPTGATSEGRDTSLHQQSQPHSAALASKTKVFSSCRPAPKAPPPSMAPAPPDIGGLSLRTVDPPPLSVYSGASYMIIQVLPHDAGGVARFVWQIKTLSGAVYYCEAPVVTLWESDASGRP